MWADVGGAGSHVGRGSGPAGPPSAHSTRRPAAAGSGPVQPQPTGPVGSRLMWFRIQMWADVGGAGSFVGTAHAYMRRGRPAFCGAAQQPLCGGGGRCDGCCSGNGRAGPTVVMLPIHCGLPSPPGSQCTTYRTRNERMWPERRWGRVTQVPIHARYVLDQCGWAREGRRGH